MSFTEALYTLAVRPVLLFFDAGRALLNRFSLSDGFATAVMIVILCLTALPLILRLAKHGFRPVELNAKQRKTDRNNRILLILCCLYMAILTGVFIPSAVISASPAEFVDAHYYQDPGRYLAHSAALGAGTYLLWWLGYGLLLTPKARKRYTVFAAIVTAVSAVGCRIRTAAYSEGAETVYRLCGCRHGGLCCRLYVFRQRLRIYFFRPAI